MTQIAQNQTPRGAVYISIAMLMISFVDNFFPIAAAEAGLWQFHIMRGFLIVPIFILISRFTGARILPRSLAHVFARTLMLGIGMLLYFAGLGLLPIAQVGAGLFTSPIWILIFSTLIFGDRIGVFRISAMIAGFSGVLLILRPDFNNLSLLTIIPLASGAFYGFSMLLTRKLCTAEDTLCLTAGSFAMLALLGIFGLTFFTIFPYEADTPEMLFLTRGWVTPSLRFWGVLLLQVVGSMGAVFLLTKAYQIGESSYIAIFEYSFLGFAAGWAWILWGTTMDMLSAAGIIVIVISGVVIALRSKSAD